MLGAITLVNRIQGNQDFEGLNEKHGRKRKPLKRDNITFDLVLLGFPKETLSRYLQTLKKKFNLKP